MKPRDRTINPESRKTLDSWVDAAIGVGRPRQGSGPRTPLYSARAMEEADDAATPATVVPPTPPRRRRRTRPVTFVNIQTPGMALLLSGQWRAFEGGRLTLDQPEDIAAMRKHPWFGNRILEETPKMQAHIAVQQMFYGRQKLRQRELAGDTQSHSRLMGPRVLEPDEPLGQFPVRRR
jgi:hypothetical protein